MKRVHAIAVTLLMALPVSSAGGGADLVKVHENASGTVRFRTPEGWEVVQRPGVPEITDARGDGLVVRIVRREGELGLDSLHVDCMLIRAGGEMQSEPAVEYEYDFVGGSLGGRRVLDSAFVVRYLEPIDGVSDWRQRNVTVVGEGESVCLVGWGPRRALKRSTQLRKLLDAVLASVEFRPWR